MPTEPVRKRLRPGQAPAGCLPTPPGRRAAPSSASLGRASSAATSRYTSLAKRSPSSSSSRRHAGRPHHLLSPQDPARGDFSASSGPRFPEASSGVVCPPRCRTHPRCRRSSPCLTRRGRRSVREATELAATPPCLLANGGPGHCANAAVSAQTGFETKLDINLTRHN